MGSGEVLEIYPLTPAIGQMMGYLDGVTDVERVALANPQHRVYRLARATGPLWIAWLDRGRVLLPEDGAPVSRATLDLGLPAVRVEPVVTEMGRSAPRPARHRTRDGRLTLELAHTPVYILPLE